MLTVVAVMRMVAEDDHEGDGDADAGGGGAVLVTMMAAMVMRKIGTRVLPDSIDMRGVRKRFSVCLPSRGHPIVHGEINPRFESAWAARAPHAANCNLLRPATS